MNDLISREAFNNVLENRDLNHEFEKLGLPRFDELSLDCRKALEAQGNAIKNVLYEQPVVIAINGDTSDGYHTFNELYHHRAVLFSVIVKAFPDKAWKSKKMHHDGTMYDGMFIVGIETPSGQATYHYEIDPYWNMFECQELERAPKWDGHTPQEAIDRIGKLTPLHVTRCKDCVFMGHPIVAKDFRKDAGWCMSHGHIVLPNDFCSDAEPMEDEDE